MPFFPIVLLELVSDQTILYKKINVNIAINSKLGRYACKAKQNLLLSL